MDQSSSLCRKEAGKLLGKAWLNGEADDNLELSNGHHHHIIPDKLPRGFLKPKLLSQATLVCSVESKKHIIRIELSTNQSILKLLALLAFRV